MNTPCGRLARLFLVVLALSAGIPAGAANAPAVLFASPQGADMGWVHLAYLEELQAVGFQPDLTDSLAQLTWERLRRFNAVVLFISPDAFDVCQRGQESAPQKVTAFVELIERYLEAGGGVFLFAGENNMGKQLLAELSERWGARFPAENIMESDKDVKLGMLTHSCQATPLAYTDQVLPSPVSNGVTGIWYPVAPAYNGGMSGPIDVDANWQVVVKASRTATSKPVDMSKSPSAIANPFTRPGGVPEPPLLAIRTLKAGRVAIINQWPQFSVGSGTTWIYNREVLDRGLKGKPSDFGRLLQNLFHWLAEPSLNGTVLGGHTTPPERLQPPNDMPTVRRDYAERAWPYDPAKLGRVEIPATLKTYRGLIGARSALSSGTGTVAEFATAARESGLDFLVFLEDFAKLTPESFAKLKAECRQNSDARLLLLAGFTAHNNIGNHMFFYGPDPVWPKDLVLTGPDKRTIYIQEENGKGGYTGMLAPYLDWVLGAYHVEKGQVGFYNFKDSPNGMRLWDCRLYAATAIRYYRAGQLEEDITDAYLKTVPCTIPPAPLVVNEVRSPDELRREATSGRPLTYAQAESLDRDHRRGLFQAALRWTHQYDSAPVYASDGPLIQAWTGCHRVCTLGGEEFVRGLALMPSPLWVTAEKGLREIRIMNGEKLFRRFLCNGCKEFSQILVLDGSVHKNLVVMAEDTAGGRAVSFARRCWKDGALSPSFCSDHVNDGLMFLAHGPYSLPFNKLPALPENLAGDTWDGGPPAIMPLATWQDTLPLLVTDKGTEDGSRFDQRPILEFSDEGAVAVQQERTELYDERVERVVNPWHTYGPIAGPSKLMEIRQSYRQWVTPTVGVPHKGWAAPGVRVGVNASLLRNELTFKEDVTVKSLRCGFLTRNVANAVLVVCNERGTQQFALADQGYPAYELRLGDWFALFPKAGLGSTQVFVNRGGPLHLKVTGHVELLAAVEGVAFRKGDTYVFEMAALGFPLDVTVAGPADLQRYIDYVRAPEGLQVRRGKRVDSPGLIELSVADGAVELAVTKPAKRLDLTLPVCVRGLNPRWAAGLFQRSGYSKGFYGPGENRYRALGLDFGGSAYVPVYVDYAELTLVVAGHPVVAGAEGKDLFIQVTNVGGTPDRWHVSVNNPTDQPVTTALRVAMELPGLALEPLTVTLQPGEYRVLR